jgi:agmatine deiminase
MPPFRPSLPERSACVPSSQDWCSEGGSIDVNGKGLLLTTEECLLSPVQARNPNLNRIQIEQALRDYLGVRRIIWLHRGIAGDGTHGHIDDFARFVSPDTVVIAFETNRSEENYEPFHENLALLSKLSLRIVPLPMPAPLVFAGHRLPASYFYIANGLVLAPTFNDPEDRVALSILSRLFPDRTVISIHAVELVWAALHDPAAARLAVATAEGSRASDASAPCPQHLR